MQARLQTATGAPVHMAEIPNFDPFYPVVGWGDRVFVIKHLELHGSLLNPAVHAADKLKADILSEGVLVYEETPAYAIVT
jgi:hypothetical protein